ncbi:MSHA biogenesis protein MshF [Vibrio rotiferianus]|uniref:MSHA biogenesis protein MshF n=1 Tax=Vibrio rotiferianus TaxID=190895 RepID=UPI00406A0B7B
MIENRASARLILWGTFVIVVLVALSVSLAPLQKELDNTGASLAKTWMLDSVNRYRSIWLMKGEPDSIAADGLVLQMTEAGLVLPLDDNEQFDCDSWLKIHYPQRKIMAANLLEVKMLTKGDGYLCTYRYSSQLLVFVTFTMTHLKIDVENSAR